MSSYASTKELLRKAAAHSAIRYLVVGVTMNFLLYLLYAGIVYLQLLGPVKASGTVYVIGVVTNYFANKGITFSHKGDTARSFVKYLLGYGFVFGLTLVSVHFLVQLLGNPYLAQFLTMCYIAVLNYFLLKFFVFRPSKEKA